MGSREDLQAILEAIPGVEEVYFQAPTDVMPYPCIVYEPSPSFVADADNNKYFLAKGYTVTVLDKRASSTIRDAVEQLQHCRFDRFFRSNGVNHFIFQLYF